VYGLAAALYGEITIDKGRVVQGNFDTYKMLLMKDMPVIEVHVVPSAEAQGGAGEPATPVIAPAVCNATFAVQRTPSVSPIKKRPEKSLPSASAL
jgi:isoquinoline 1-oxidoreductase beta subunit